MPPPTDLTGRRFGKLTVLDRAEKPGYWRCRCDCGNEQDIRQPRLPYCPSNAARRETVDACDDCRAKPCVVCGGPIPARSNAVTCSAECARERKNQINREYYQRKSADPLYRRDRREQGRAIMAAKSPEERRVIYKKKRAAQIAAQGHEGIKAAARAYYAERMEEDPGYAEKRRKESAAWRENNPEKSRDHARRYRLRRLELDAARDLSDAATNLTEKLNDGTDD